MENTNNTDYSNEEWFKELREKAAQFNVELTSSMLVGWNKEDQNATIPLRTKQFLDWCDNHSVAGYTFNDYLRDDVSW